MSGLMELRDNLRDFLRKNDEVTSPLIRFFASLVMFISINGMFGYSELYSGAFVIILLSIICALVSGSISVLLSGCVILINTMNVSVEIAAVYLVFFVLMYCMYLRMFPNSGYVVILSAILCMLKLRFAVPVVVMILAGAAGIIPAVFGLLLYYLSVYTEEVAGLLDANENVQAYSYIVNNVIKNKEVLTCAVAFFAAIAIGYIFYRMPVKNAWNMSIIIGSICDLMFAMICGAILKADISVGNVILGMIAGLVIAYIIQFFKGVLDYEHVENVQFEDDEYYYYVKAVPKLVSPKKKQSMNKTEARRNTQGAVKAQRSASETERPVQRGVGGAERPMQRGVGGAERPMQRGVSGAERPVQRGVSGAERPMQRGVSGAERPVQRGVSGAERPVQRGVSGAERPVQRGVSGAERPIQRGVSGVERQPQRVSAYGREAARNQDRDM